MAPPFRPPRLLNERKKMSVLRSSDIGCFSPFGDFGESKVRRAFPPAFFSSGGRPLNDRWPLLSPRAPPGKGHVSVVSVVFYPRTPPS